MTVDLNHYILEDGEPRAVDMETWMKWLDSDEDFSKRRIAQTFVGNVKISTVFLTTNHRFHSEGAPIVFETLIFGGELDLEMDRYETVDDALLGHEQMVARVRASQSSSATDNSPSEG